MVSLTRIRLLTLFVAALALFSRDAHAWGTVEHIRFGDQIAAPFEQSLLGRPLPVFTPTGGPQRFGHWVSAPDFGRSLRRFFFQQPVHGDLACAVLWSET